MKCESCGKTDIKIAAYRTYIFVRCMYCENILLEPPDHIPVSQEKKWLEMYMETHEM